MFQDYQFSALLLCYGPLFLVIAGFIAFAALGDKNARRTYLRRLDLRPDTAVDEVEPVILSAPVKAATPAGLKVAIEPTETAVREAVEPPAVAPVAVEAEPDDLKKIEGIGPKISSVLVEAGVTTFSALADATPQALRSILDQAGMSAIHDPTSWPEQARLAAAGQWDELQTLQDNLRGGRQA